MPAVLDMPETEQKPEVVQATRIDAMITYPVSKSDILQLRTKFSGLNCDTPKDYEKTRLAIAECRELRVKVEKRRKELKADSLEFGRKVDSVAKFLTAELEQTEEPLALLKGKVDDAKEKKKADEKAAELAKIRAEQEAELKARADAHEAKLREARLIEEAKLKEEQAKLLAERQAMEAKQKEAAEKQAKIDAENKRVADELAAKHKAIDEANRIERAKIDAEKAAIEAAKQKAEREDFIRQAKLEAERVAKEKAEDERIAAEKAKADELARQQAEQARIEAIKPDVSKVHDFAKAIRSLQCPGLKSDEAREFVHTATVQMAEIAEVLESFQP